MIMIEATERDIVKVGRLNKLLSRIAEHSPELATTLTLSVIALGGGHLLLNPANVDASSYGDQDRAITQVAPDYGKNEMNAILSSMGGNGLDQVGTGDGGAGGPNPEGTPVAQITLSLTTDGLNIRSLNNLTSLDIGDVLNGEQVTFNFAQTSSNGDVWWNITAKGVTGWIAKNVGGTIYITNDTPVATPEAVGAPLAPTNNENATATAEAPLQITVILPDGSNVTATATPSPEVPDANTPPGTIQVYETPDGTTKFYLTKGDRIDSPRFREVADGRIEDLHAESGRPAVDSLLPVGFWDAYPDAEWNVDMHMYQLPDGRFVVPGLGDGVELDIEAATQNISMDMQTPDFVEGQAGYRLIITMSDHQISQSSFTSKMSQDSEEILLSMFSDPQISVLPGTTIVTGIAPEDTYANDVWQTPRMSENGDIIMSPRIGSIFASGSNRGSANVMYVRVQIGDAVETVQGNTGWGVSVLKAIAAELHYFRGGNFDPNFVPDVFIQKYFNQIWEKEGYTYQEGRDYFFGF